MNTTKQNRILEIICFSLFIICTIFISFYHEPWHDEFQAWGISKDSLYNIVFVLPHLEGHPPLWHLILKCFSSFIENPEIGLRIPNLIFIYASVFLLIFKSPMPKILRLALPFTYFIFYQYAVMSRPYSIYCFALFLAAIFYKDKNEHPFRYISALSLLALSCAYGMVISAGIIIVWFIEIIKRQGFALKSFIRDKRFYAMLIIFFVCLCIVFLIHSDPMVAYSPRFNEKILIKTFYILFILPADTLITNYCTSVYKLSDINFLYCFIGLGIYALLFIVLKRYKMLMMFSIPYCMFLMCAFLYIETHHFGMLTLFYIFVLWCACYNCSEEAGGRVRNIFKYFAAVCICMQIYWSIAAYIHDYKYDIWFGRKTSRYIKEQHLEKYYMMPEWSVISYYYNKESKEKLPLNINVDINLYENFLKNYERIDDLNFYSQGSALTLNMYFNKNLFKTFNMHYPDKMYIIMKKNTPEEIKEITAEMHDLGLPDIFIGNPVLLSYIFSKEELEGVYYDIIHSGVFYSLFKDKMTKRQMAVFARSSISSRFKKDYSDADFTED